MTELKKAADAAAGWHQRAAATRRARSEASLLAAAADVFEEAGFAAATVETIAARAGVGPATVYRRFESKAALLSAALAFAVPERPQDLRLPIATALTRHLVRVAALVGHRPELAEALLPVMASRALRSASGPPDLADPIAELLRVGCERGELRPDTDPEELAPMILNLLLIRVLRRNESGRASAERVAAMVLSGAFA